MAIYGAESWMWNKGIAKQLATFERRVLKRIAGGNESKWTLEKVI